MSPCGGDLLLRLAAHDFQHIIHGWVNGTAMNSRSSLGQLCHHSFLMLGGLYHHSLELCFRNRQIQLIGSLDVRNFLEHIHKLWQIEELCKSGSGSVAGSFGVEFVKILFVDFLN